MREEITINGELSAIILKARYDESGIHFLTVDELPRQLGSMNYGPGKVISAHAHRPTRQEFFRTLETLFIRKGKVRVNFYTNEQEYRCSRILQTGDVILLMHGGHGFEVLEELNMVEVKQGPYTGDEEKLVFASPLPSKLHFE